MDGVALHVIGNLGVLLILGAYLLVSTGRVQSFSPRYQSLNLIGAVIMIGYSVALVAWASVVLNSVWALIALVSLISHARRAKVEATRS